MWSKFVLLPYLQQLPDFGLPRFQLGNVVFIAAPGAVDAAANLIDVRGNAADSGGEFLLLRVVHLDDLAVNRHLPEICSHVLCSELRHLCLDDSFLIVGDKEEYLIWSRSVCHRRSVLS